MSCSHPSANEAKLSPPISDLADACLEEIFKRLPPYERLIVSELCRRWHGISRKAWLDISKIDLSPIPGKHIGAIVNQCVNLQSVVAVNKTFDANELTCLANVPSVKRLSFHRCNFKLNPDKASIEQSIFSDSLEHASWTEFVLHSACLWVPVVNSDAAVSPLGFSRLFNVAMLPASLSHLQLSGIWLCEPFSSISRRLSASLDGLERLENLECFILYASPLNQTPGADDTSQHELVLGAMVGVNVFEKIGRLKHLKELCVCPAVWRCSTELVDLLSSLPKLEVLFLTHVLADNIAEDLAELITANSVLRILVLSGAFSVDEPIELPARKRFPHGFGSDPLPLLHIFVGRDASENIRFVKSASDAAIIHPINQPIPEFLEREDIAPIFEDVWVAKNIKEAAKYDGKFWGYEISDTASSIQRV